MMRAGPFRPCETRALSHAHKQWLWVGHGVSIGGCRCYGPPNELESANDMNRSLNKPVRAGVAVASMAIASVAFAAPTSEWQYIGEFQSRVSTQGLATQAFQSPAGLATAFEPASTLTLDAQAAAAAADAMASERRRALSASVESNAAPVVGSPAALNLTLWNFITNIRAQQVSNPFVQLRTSAASIDYTINNVPAPVPLPPAAWLFGIGLAVLGVARLCTRGERANALAPA